MMISICIYDLGWKVRLVRSSVISGAGVFQLARRMLVGDLIRNWALDCLI